MSGERCRTCDRPLTKATGKDLSRAIFDEAVCVQHDPDNPAWGPRCRRKAVDWRARALAAEAVIERIAGLSVFDGGAVDVARAAVAGWKVTP